MVYAPDSSPRTNLGINIESSLGKIKSNGVELCSIEIAAHRSWDNSEVILGSIPYINPYTQPTPLKNWPLLEDTLITLKNQIVQKTFLPVESIISYKKCYFIDEGWLIPVFEIHITNDRKSFKVFADDSKIWSVEPLNLHSSRNAKALAYSSNPNNLEVEQDILVDASGYLQNTVFQTYTNAVERLQSSPEMRNGSEVHIFSVLDNNIPKKGELNAFTHVWKAYQYFQSLGYTNPDGLIDIELNITVNNSLNNAAYNPKGSLTTNRPRISLSSGDGEILQNLSLDSDVVSHELGHHTLWRSLRSTVGEGLILHEGLADFFAFASQGNSCLGESICPVNSNFCWYKGQCLRSAENEISYQDDTYNSVEAHMKGQMISGMLWDLHSDHAIDLFSLSKLVFNAIDLMTSSSTIIDLVLALNIADRQLNNGLNLCFIKEVAENRGLAPYINMDTCTQSSSWSAVEETSGTNSSGSQTTTATSTSSSSEKDKGFFGFCAMNNSQTSEQEPIIAFLFFILTPMFFSVFIQKLYQIS